MGKRLRKAEKRLTVRRAGQDWDRSDGLNRPGSQNRHKSASIQGRKLR